MPQTLKKSTDLDMIHDSLGSYNASTGYNLRTVVVVDRSGSIAYVSTEASGQGLKNRMRPSRQP